MKRHFLPVLVGLALLLVAFVPARKGAPPLFHAKGRDLFLNGGLIPRPWEWSAVKFVLGMPDRTLEEGNHSILVFDSRGFRAVCDAKSTFVRWFTLYFAGGAAGGSEPEKAFTETAGIDKLSVLSTTPEGQVKAKLKAWNWGPGTSAGSLRGEMDGLIVTLEYSGGKLLRLSLGLKGNGAS